MSESVPAAVTKPQKKVAAKPRKPAEHPKYAEMVAQAVSSLKERGGSSRQAILKYIVKTFKVGNDEKIVNTHLKMALKSCVKNGSLKQSKGTGASGSFRMGEVKKAVKKPKKVTKPKAAAKKPKVKKTTKPKDSAAKKSTAKPKKTTGTPKKAKKATAAKPKKDAKPKKATAAKPKKTEKAAKPKKAATAAKGKKTATKPKKTTTKK